MHGLRALSPTAETYARACALRLREDPRDPDALFARAAILASLGRRAEALVTLDRLARLAPTYPGLWRFKARLFRDLGDPRMADLCLEAARREDL